ncbi:hypothetical protein IFM89_033386 [Coptis chinensis]|uniref:Uncharacterized protein n=1 Tax=Coptis chinensis TaxID=261450 RepID=A0A835HFZ8_9MAGN|nr:hypothetical protein IFM89_033386 [Coptis chinensis]
MSELSDSTMTYPNSKVRSMHTTWCIDRPSAIHVFVYKNHWICCIYRRAFADYAIGFGNAAIGGKFGDIYEVSNPANDPINPKPGTLRYGDIQKQPLWIILARDMVIKLQN